MYEAKEIRLLPDQKRSGAAVLVGLERAARTTAARLFFNVTLMDSQCDNTYGLKAFIDAMYPDSTAAETGAHVLFGPSCEYCLGEFKRNPMLALQYSRFDCRRKWPPVGGDFRRQTKGETCREAKKR